MPKSLSEVIDLLLRGQILTWPKFGKHKSGSIQLTTPAARRLFEFLSTSEASAVSEANEALFDGLISAWQNTAADPATLKKPLAKTSSTRPWRLARIETSNFGGLNSFEGPVFTASIDEKNWCLEGQNGSGKTSIASAIIWAITGYRVRDQEGPIREDGKRTAVLNDSSEQIGDWPAISSYPPTVLDLKGVAKTWVKLTFQNADGDEAIALRKLEAAPQAPPIIKVEVDDRLQQSPQLIETGLLMPARLARIGFGERSQSLYEAVKSLTGLDQLSDIGEGASNFGHRAKRFLKYAQDAGIGTIRTRIDNYLKRIDELTIETKFQISITKKLGEDGYEDDLELLASSASDQAGQQLSVLTTEISSSLNVQDPIDRSQIKSAVATARGIIHQKTSEIGIFESWAALHSSHSDTNFQAIPGAIENAYRRLAAAEIWHERQQGDEKLRLKALASNFFTTSVDPLEIPQCPLCEEPLAGSKGSALASQLAELKTASHEAEQKLSDACNQIDKDLSELLPAALAKNFVALSIMQPRDAFEKLSLARFSNEPPFSDVLVGISDFTKTKVEFSKKSLPTFEFTATDSSSESGPASTLRARIRLIERVTALVEWWSTNRQSFTTAWIELKGTRNDDGEFPNECLEGKLALLEIALDKASPLDEIAKLLREAATDCKRWKTINNHQKVREDISEALEPLKDLRLLVSNETSNSIATLSETIKSTLDRIHFRERLSFEEAGLVKRNVNVSGSFDHGIRIDASTVANTSWLRAILWAFMLALREQTIAALGKNHFPLMVLDDPQTTFDPRNKRKWAEEIARLANLDTDNEMSCQLILTTHERQFFQMLVNVEKLSSEQGLISGVNKTTRVATIVNGSSLARSFDEAKATNDDEAAHAYVFKIRTYCEDLLKIMLRSVCQNASDLTLDELMKEIDKLKKGSVAPYNQSPFSKLLDIISGGGGGKPIKLLNDSHHKYDGTIGLAQAEM